MLSVKQFPDGLNCEVVKLCNLYKKPHGSSNALNPYTCHMVHETVCLYTYICTCRWTYMVYLYKMNEIYIILKFCTWSLVKLLLTGIKKPIQITITRSLMGDWTYIKMYV